MRRTIREVVLDALERGRSADEAWEIAKNEFPFHCVSWGYIRHLKHAYLHRRDANPTDTGSVT